MREILADIERWRSAGQAGGPGPGGGARGLRAPAARGHHGRLGGGRGGRVGIRRLRRGGRGDRGARGAVRCRGRRGCAASATPTTRRSRSGSPAAGRSASSSSRSTGEPPLRDPGRRHPGRAARGAGRDRARVRPSRWEPSCSSVPVRPRRSTAPSATPTWTGWSSRDAQGELAAGLTATRHYGRHGEARERDVSVFIESFAAPAADDHLRGRRLHRRRSPRWPRSWATGSRSATPGRCSPPVPGSPWRTRSWWPGRTPISPRSGPTWAARRDLRAHPRPEVRRAGHRLGPGHRGRVHRRHGITPHDRQAGDAPAGGGRRRRRAGPGDGPDRPGHRGPHPRGDGRGHLRRDHRPAHRPDGTVASRPSRPDPPRPRTGNARVPPHEAGGGGAAGRRRRFTLRDRARCRPQAAGPVPRAQRRLVGRSPRPRRRVRPPPGW